MKLVNKVAIVTGGSQGLGRAISLAMAQEGARVVICARNAGRLAEAEAEIAATGATCRALTCDVASVESVAALFRETVATFGTLDILVNNAAVVPTGPRNDERRSRFYRMATTPVPKESLGVTRDLSDEEWHAYWGTNMHGVFYCTREALRIMEPKRSGKIINIASIAGISGFSPFAPAYCATKGAMLAFTRSVAVEVAGANIFINAIAPGGILTAVMQRYLASISAEARDRISQLIPLGRMGTPEEYASLAVYLATDEHYLVGQTISPSGGMVL